MRVFAKVAEKGSFARAAQALDLSNAVVTRHVAELEARLGVRLMHRTTRKLSLTGEGELYLKRVQSILEEIDEAELLVGCSASEPAGALRLYCSKMFGQHQLTRLIHGFCSKFPRVVPDITISEGTPDLVEEGFDIGILTDLQSFDASMIARKLARSKIILCASPDYISKHGEPRQPEDLIHHACLNVSFRQLRHHWPITRPDGIHYVPIKSRLYANDGEFLRRCALEGMGIVARPSYSVDDDLSSGRLVRLLASLPLHNSSITMVYPSRRLLSATVQGFVDYMKEKFPEPEADPWTDNLAP